MENGMQEPQMNQRSASSPFEIVLPATSANLGPGFDSLAVGLDLYLKIEARAASKFSIIASGRDAALCTDVSNNLILETYQEILNSQQRQPLPLALTLTNEIPIGKGCGSSAAARLAGIALASHFGQLHWSGQEILEEAARRENHPDNVAACWLGGLVVAQSSDDTKSSKNNVRALRIASHSPWQFLLVVPPDRLSTNAAREVLPRSCSFSDAVGNIQNATLLIAAFVQGRGDLLRFGFSDKLHEPYRAALCPLLQPMHALVGQAGILGAALSGSGPSVLMVIDSQAPRAQTERLVQGTVASAGLSAELIFTSMGRGAMTRQLHPATIAEGERQ